MRIYTESRITHPREVVYHAYRDRLAEIAAYIPDIRAIEEKSREDLGGGQTKVHNEWIGDREVPRFARGFLSPEAFRWDDYAEWDDGKHHVHWSIKLRMFTDSVTCGGVNSFREIDENTAAVVLDGDLQIDLASIPGVPSLLARPLKPKVDEFIVSLIKPNLIQVNKSLQAFLDENPAS